MREVNDLGFTLQRQRTEAVESTALLTHVMEEIALRSSRSIRRINCCS
jgi:hypothetical protein